MGSSLDSGRREDDGCLAPLRNGVGLAKSVATCSGWPGARQAGAFPRPEAWRWCRASGGAQRSRLDLVQLNSATSLHAARCSSNGRRGHLEHLGVAILRVCRDLRISLLNVVGCC